jgi:hypothetical protein
MRKLSEIKESIWADIYDRSTGETTRKEDSVDLLDLGEFAEYVNEHYVCTERYARDEDMKISINQNKTSFGLLSFAIRNNGTCYFNLHLDCDNDNNYRCSIDKHKSNTDIYDLLREKYIVTESKVNWDYTIEPHKGNVTNSFFLEVLDYLMNNVKPPIENVLEKK